MTPFKWMVLTRGEECDGTKIWVAGTGLERRKAPRGRRARYGNYHLFSSDPQEQQVVVSRYYISIKNWAILQDRSVLSISKVDLKPVAQLRKTLRSGKVPASTV